MNKNFAVTLAISVCLIIFIGIYISNTQDKADTSKIIFTSTVSGCAETNKGMVESRDINTDTPPKIDFEGNEIVYTRSPRHLCCRKSELKYEFKENVINLYEVWSGKGCKCMCSSNIKATIGNLLPGAYTVNVYESGTEPSGTEQNNKLISNIVQIN